MEFSSFRDRVVQTWIALQVELHGQCSVHRLLAFHEYNSSRSSLLSVGALVLSLVPCIAVVVVIDLPRLARPGDGLASSQVLWIRAGTSTGLIAFMLLQQMRILLPDLGIRQSQIVAITFIVAIGATIWAFGLASLIGYPLPFTFAAGSPMFMTILISSVWVLWGKTFAQSARLRRQLKQYLLVVVVQWALTLIYPIFNFFFLQLGSIAQTALAMTLPLVKILMKYWLAGLLDDLSDLQPQFVIFNVEVFHALFVAYCMQNAISIWTNVAIMAMDALHAWASIHDVSIQLHKLTTTLYDGQATPTDPASRRLPPLVDSVLYVLCRPGVLASISANKAKPHVDSVLVRSLASRNAIVPHPTAVVATPLAMSLNPSCPEDLVAISKLPLQLTESQSHLLGSLKLNQQIAYVQDALALLHMTEFILLIEYVEVIIPVIYSIYLVVVYHLPNRIYYPQLRAMDDSRLHHVVQNVLLYAGLEFLSFIVLDWVLRRKVEFRPVRLLAFVLSTQWFIVQAKLILWLVYMVQASLVHFGADYSLQFKWLRNNTYFD